MKKIGPKNSIQEIYIKGLISRLGYSFKLHSDQLPGKPDFVFPKYKKVIFINGCFWHGHSKCKRLPRTNTKYWRNKIENNKARDYRNYRKLNRYGWRYMCIWQCRIKKSNEELLRSKIINFLI